MQILFGMDSPEADSASRPLFALPASYLPFFFSPQPARTMTTKEIKTPPIAPKRPHSFEIHGETINDDYAWLREKESPEVIAHLEAENAYTAAMTEHLADLKEEIYHEIVGRIKETDRSVPIEEDGYFYYTRTEEGLQYSIMCRRHGSMESEEEVLLDLNSLAEESEVGYVGLGSFAVSPDHKLLAYSLDLNGSEQYTIRIKNLERGEHLPDEIPGVYYGLVWGNNNQEFLYTLTDVTHRPNRIMHHTLGTPSGEDREVMREDDSIFRIGVGNTTDRRYALINIGSSETTETHLLSLDNLDGETQIVSPRRTGHQYGCDHREGTLYITTNNNAPDFRLVTASLGETDPEKWTEMVAERPEITIAGVQVFEQFIAMATREKGRTEVSIYRFGDQTWERIPFDEESYVVYPRSNSVFTTKRLRVVYNSLTTPASTFDYDIETGELHLLKRTEIRGGYNPEEYRTERTFATADDGTQIPISLVYRIDTYRGDGSNPALLYSYGSYGIVVDPNFSFGRLSLLDRGFVFAIAHIRGGMDLGRAWYDNGKMKMKENTFTDFIACGNHLVQENYTSHEKLAIMGGSAGGLLMGAVINKAPELAKAAVAQVPFVDVINTMLDDTLPLTTGEYEEWGNPNDPEYFQIIRAYSPYDNVAPLSYPDLLVTAGLNDPRVQYWEPAKWVAKLREQTTSTGPLLLKTNMGAGHGGASGRYDGYREIAEEYAFVVDRCGA